MKIIIKKPCTENWNAMTPNEQGRFCDACEKTVVDFSKMSDLEIYHALHHKTGKVCGRLSAQQIENFNAAHEEFPSTSNLKKWSLAAMLAGVLAYPHLTQAEINFQSSLASVMPVFNHPDDQENSASNIAVPVGDSVVFSGKVIDKKSHVALVGATLYIEGGNTTAQTDANGKFTIKIPKSEKSMALVASYGDEYYTLSKTFTPNKSKSNIVFELEYDPSEKFLMGDVIFEP